MKFIKNIRDATNAKQFELILNFHRKRMRFGMSYVLWTFSFPLSQFSKEPNMIQPKTATNIINKTNPIISNKFFIFHKNNIILKI